MSGPSPMALLPCKTEIPSSLTYRTLKIGFSVNASIICSEWNSSAPRELKSVPHGDQLKPAIPTLWKPFTMLRIFFVTTFHTATCFGDAVGSTESNRVMLVDSGYNRGRPTGLSVVCLS